MSRKASKKNRREIERIAGKTRETRKSAKTRAVTKWLIILVSILSVCSLAICFIIFYSYTLLKPPEQDWKTYRIVPEYMRSMKKVLISLPLENATIPTPSLDIHLGLVQYFPAYTEIILLLPESRLQTIKAEFKDKPNSENITYVVFETKQLNNGHLYLLFSDSNRMVDSGAIDDLVVPKGTAWAQDLFEVSTKPDGRKLLMVSEVHKYFISYGSEGSPKAVNDNAYIDNLSSGDISAQTLPFTFMGGNILVDEFDSRKIVVCGGDIFRYTQTVSGGTKDSTPTDTQITAMIKKFLNADTVISVGMGKPQPLFMFHLDQAMIFLHDGVVGITTIVGAHQNVIPEEVKDVEQFLSELRSALTRLGYKLVNIDTSIQDVLSYQYAVNGIPYVDATTKQKTLLMPISPETQTTFEKKLVKKNTATFESLGYEVVHVPSESTKFNGGIHCLVNVIE
ncbi:MAG: agmatine deiminase family protein [Candidatus Brocadiaceae bacterium]|nr:agmatine deiminase family protein [Candidatus Brocadiaceae bacterium]